MKMVALAGGVGGAKMVDGLAQCLLPEELTVIVNTADDFEYLGLRISPDLDTVCYTLAGVANDKTGWGRSNEGWLAFDTIKVLGGPTWFMLGDRDIGLHLFRTKRLENGDSLTEVTGQICAGLKVGVNVLPMSDNPVRTIVHTREYGDLSFQDYFVKHKYQPAVEGFTYTGIEEAAPADGVLESIDECDVVVICPSNPWVSVGPILGVPGIADALMHKEVIAVSPIIGGRAVKGPAAKMYEELGFTPSALTVAENYRHLIKGFVLDLVDENMKDILVQWGIISLTSSVIMVDKGDRKRLALEIIGFADRILENS